MNAHSGVISIGPGDSKYYSYELMNDYKTTSLELFAQLSDFYVFFYK